MANPELWKNAWNRMAGKIEPVQVEFNPFNCLAFTALGPLKHQRGKVMQCGRPKGARQSPFCWQHETEAKRPYGEWENPDAPKEKKP